MANLILPERKRLYLPGTPQQFTADAYGYRPVLSVSAPGFNDNNVPGNALTHAVRAQSGYSDVGWGATGDGTSANTSRYRYTHNAANTTTLTAVVQVTAKPFNASYLGMLVEQTYDPNLSSNAAFGPFFIVPYYAGSSPVNNPNAWSIAVYYYAGGLKAGRLEFPSPEVGKPVTIAVTFDRQFTGAGIVTSVYVNGVPQSLTLRDNSPGMENSLFAATDVHIHARGVNQGTPSVYNYAAITHGIALFSTADTAFAREISKDLRAVYRPQKRVVYFDVGAGGGSQSLTPSLYTNTNTFYAHTVTTGAVTLTPSLFTNSNTFYSHTLTSGIILTPALYANNNTFNAHTVTPGSVTLSPSLYSNNSTFNAHTITPGAVALTPSFYENSNTFYSAIVSTGGSVLQPSLYENSNTFYSATITTGAVTLTPSLYSNTSSFYSHTVSTGAVSLTPSLYTNNSVFYSHTVSPGAITLTPSLYSNENTFYAHVLEQQGGTKYLVQSATFTNDNAFYNATITTGAVTLTPSLFTNNSTFNSHAISARYDLLPSIVTNGSIFYSPTVTTSAPVLRPSLFTNSNTFYTHVVSRVGEVPLDILEFQLYMNQDINFTLAINGSKSFALEI